MFKLEEFIGRRVISSLFQDEGIIAFFATRDLPLKAGERDDLLEEVENNKKLVCQELSIPFENLTIPEQTHSDNIGIVKNAEYFENTDALITDQPNVALALNFADCVPILFYDSVQKVVAAAHAGWRGTVAKIGPKTVQKMIEEFSCKPSDIIAVIGPAIGKCCFEVKEDVLKQLAESIDIQDAVGVETPTYFAIDAEAKSKPSSPAAGGLVNPPYAHDSSRALIAPQNEQSKVGILAHHQQISNAFSDNHADLKLINKLQLLACGLEKIDVCEYCTSCQNELFFSYRRENGNTARHSAVIFLKN
jgi:YfiH family protein